MFRRWNGSAWQDIASFRRWNGSAWQDIASFRRWNGSAWQDSNLKKWNGSAWETIFPVERNLYNYGDQCTSLTGGWGRIINLWPRYGTYVRSSSRYIDYNTDHINIRTYYWEKNGSVATQNAVDLTNYKKVNILYDFYPYQADKYSNSFIWGVCNGPLTNWYDDYDPPKVLCNGYTYRHATAISINYQNDQILYNNQVHSIDISDLTGLWYIFTVPASFSWYGDYTIVKIKRVWLSN